MGHMLLPNDRIVTLALQHMEVLCYNGLRFEFIKFVWERNSFAGKINSAYVLRIKTTYPVAVLYFFCLLAPQADLTRFWRVIVRWVSTAKRKTRLHTDFRS